MAKETISETLLLLLLRTAEEGLGKQDVRKRDLRVPRRLNAVRGKNVSRLY